MDEKKTQGFHTVEVDVEEIKQKIRNHRKKVFLTIVSTLLAVLLIGMITFLYFRNKEYTDYEVLNKIERTDSVTTQYATFDGKILRYNNDGATYADTADTLIWNQAYEMVEPVVDVCQSYVAIADKQGTQLFVMSVTGVECKIETNKPIVRVSVANQGTVAVLTQEKGTTNLELYDKTGKNLASGEIHMQNSGFPLDIALSQDGTKLAVSTLDISEGKVKTSLSFYNFGSVGQNEIDNVVGTYYYKDTVIPEVQFVSNDRLIAFGNGIVLIYEGTQKPEEVQKLEFQKEIKSIFYDDSYFGLVFNRGEEHSGKHLAQVYNMKADLVLEQKFNMNFTSIELLDNHELCIMDEYACAIYSLYGVKKYRGNFDSSIRTILSGKTDRYYTFVLEEELDKVRLK